MSCPVMKCHVALRRVVPCRVLSLRIASRRVALRRAVPCHAAPRRAMPSNKFRTLGRKRLHLLAPPRPNLANRLRLGQLQLDLGVSAQLHVCANTKPFSRAGARFKF
eukprot:10788247-Lingulodinium_polyedra.AAC.1